MNRRDIINKALSKSVPYSLRLSKANYLKLKQLSKQHNVGISKIINATLDEL